MRGKPFLFRIAGIAAAPLIPVVLLVKIIRRLRAKPAYLGSFLRSLPMLLLFIVAWAAGEAWGYLTAPCGGSSSLPSRQPLST